MEFKDYYQVMGVARDATQDEIKRAYRQLARKHHPDVSKASDAEERFKELGEANEVLKDPEKRAAYDRLGANWKKGQDFQPPPDWNTDFESSSPGFGGQDTGEQSDFLSRFFAVDSPANKPMRRAPRATTPTAKTATPKSRSAWKRLTTVARAGSPCKCRKSMPMGTWYCANTRSNSPFRAAYGPGSASGWPGKADPAWAKASAATFTWRSSSCLTSITASTNTTCIWIFRSRLGRRRWAR